MLPRVQMPLSFLVTSLFNAYNHMLATLSRPSHTIVTAFLLPLPTSHALAIFHVAEHFICTCTHAAVSYTHRWSLPSFLYAK